MKQYILQILSADEISRLLVRPSDSYADLEPTVRGIIATVAAGGDAALRGFTEKFDHVSLQDLKVSAPELTKAESLVSKELKEAISVAAKNIETFHRAQMPGSCSVETMPGVVCSREWRPIQRVGLYIPGGTAPLVSTLLMLGIPAGIAGCPEIIICSPPTAEGKISPAILYVAGLHGLNTIFKTGGAQAIAAMAVGTETIPKVDKIFGPGNKFVAAAKSIITQPPYNVAIDVNAGPTEFLIIADESAEPAWVASDLLAQAEHGEDSQVVLVTTSIDMATAVEMEIEKQLKSLSRQQTVAKALAKSFMLVVDTMKEAINFSNRYAPEHLLMAVRNPGSWKEKIINAGSVFIGDRTSGVFGDYSSGTNHTLPTSGAARNAAGVTVESFMKSVFFQEITKEGFDRLAKTTAILAEAEGLDAHANAIYRREVQND